MGREGERNEISKWVSDRIGKVWNFKGFRGLGSEFGADL